MYKSASIKKLSLFGTDKPATPQLIKQLWSSDSIDELEQLLPYPASERFSRWLSSMYKKPDLRHAKMSAIEVITVFSVGHCGLEHLGFDKKGREIDYLNVGDSYALTIVFYGTQLLVSSWGDIAESTKLFDCCGMELD